MIKKLIVFACIIASLNSWAQDNTASPYSYYGLGEVKFKGTQDARAMGGLSITGDSIQLNLMNPASFSKLKMTTFAVGGTGNFTTFKTDAEKEKAQRTSFDYLAIGLPMGKFGMSFGLMPYSAVGYKNQRIEDRVYTSQGNGFINKVFIGGAYEINKNLNFGFDLNYHFGDITNIFTERVLQPDYSYYTSRERNFTELNGISYTFGLLYDRKINSKIKLNTSLTYSPESKLSTNNSRNIATVIYTSTGTELFNDSEDIQIPNNDLIIPSKISLGFGLSESRKWLIGSEITFTQNKNLVNRFDEIPNLSFENSTRIALGGYYIPKYDSFSSYFERIVYRGGFKYENTGLVLKNESINDYGMNFGFGLPLGFSKVDLGFEFGKRGTTKNGLIQENYFNLSIGLNLNAKWFEKRKID
ncbi:MAG: hypothetical protein ACKO8L_08880 [Flavobacterium sp.]|jgi:hypothetical protein